MAKNSAQMTIGALGRATSVSPETIRYYERIGILPEPARTAAGYRVYKPEHVRRLYFIRRGRELGLTLATMRELLSLASDSLGPCTRVDRLVHEHIHDLDHKIEGLQQLRGALQELADSCGGTTRVADCRILEALQNTETPLASPPAVCADEVCAKRTTRASRKLPQ